MGSRFKVSFERPEKGGSILQSLDCIEIMKFDFLSNQKNERKKKSKKGVVCKIYVASQMIIDKHTSFCLSYLITLSTLSSFP